PQRRVLSACLAVGLVGACLLPWYALPDDVAWPSPLFYRSAPTTSAAAQAVAHGRAWLAPIVIVLLALAGVARRTSDRRQPGGLHDAEGAVSLGATIDRLLTTRIWGLHCLTSTRRCGVAWNTLALALACGAGCTGLGLAFALIATRTSFRAKALLRTLTVLP